VKIPRPTVRRGPDGVKKNQQRVGKREQKKKPNLHPLKGRKGIAKNGKTRVRMDGRERNLFAKEQERTPPKKKSAGNKGSGVGVWEVRGLKNQHPQREVDKHCRTQKKTWGRGKTEGVAEKGKKKKKS